MMQKPAIWKGINLPNTDQIVLASEYENGGILSLHDMNHNLFCLDKDGNIVWQVRRFECGKHSWRHILRRVRDARRALHAWERHPDMEPDRKLMREWQYGTLEPDGTFIPATWPELLRHILEMAERNLRWEFSELWLEDTQGERFQANEWRPGLKLIALAHQGLEYELDVNTGVAVNITPMPHRLW